ncbi:MAG: deoxyguanosinetriphosphate triphosphohydrolase [Salinivirgaceae bacterium]
MQWDKLLTPMRFGKEELPNLELNLLRSEFQRDYDRLIFSSPFRRLQNKTQVFPLPGSVFVHNRLTHSLEVASVGRSLGSNIAASLAKHHELNPFIHEIGSIVATASLAHDLGNPPFGHAGEKAISEFFVSGQGIFLKTRVNEQQWADLTNFEGNANALRLLTHKFNGRRAGGYVLTYATLASMLKYPFNALHRTRKNKYGYFDSETETFLSIVKQTGLLKLSETKPVYARHPLVYLVEAADDISYQIMDLEDAHKLGILSTNETSNLLTAFFDKEKQASFWKKKDQIYQQVSDKNEQIAFLRASVINHLVNTVAQIFLENEKTILKGVFSGSLVDYLSGTEKLAMETCKEVAWKKIYSHRSVIEIEITGYNVINTLLKEFTHAMFHNSDDYSKKLLSLLPVQYHEEHQCDYEKARSVLDFISGMTDLYVLDLYKLIKGIGI